MIESQDTADTVYQRIASSIAKSYDDLNTGFSLNAKLDAFNLHHLTNEKENGEQIENSDITIKNSKGNISLGVNFPINDTDSLQMAASFNNMQSTVTITRDGNKEDYSFVKTSLSAYLDKGIPYLDLSDSNTKNSLPGPLSKILSFALKTEINESTVRTAISLLKGKTAIGGLEIPDIKLPEIDSDSFDVISEGLSIINPLMNKSFINTYKEYEGSSYGLKLYADSNGLNDLIAYDFSFDGDSDYAKVNNDSYANVVAMFDEESRLSSLDIDLNMNYESLYEYKTTSDDLTYSCEYSKEVKSNIKIKCSINLNYGASNLDFPDFSKFNFVDVSSFLN